MQQEPNNSYFNHEHKENELLKQEMYGLFNHIQKIRREIASIRNPNMQTDHFTQMSDELDAIVAATESATETIMERVENIDEIVADVFEKVENQELKEKLGSVPDIIGDIFEACSFQDITGQRVTKIVKSLQYIENRVNSLISAWGKDALSKLDIHPPPETDEYKKYLHGPSGKGEGVCQDDVDNFFETDNVEALKEKADEDAPFSRQEAAKFKHHSEEEKKKEKKPAAAAPDLEVNEGEEVSPLAQDDIDALFD